MVNLAIKSLEQLKKNAFNENGDFVEFFILLAGGLARSSKRISYHPESDEFLIINEIDDSFQTVNSEEIALKTNIVESISKNCLFQSS